MTKYHEYQLQWMIDHGYSLNDLIEELTKVQNELLEDSTEPLPSIAEVFNEWEASSGFGSEIWVCEAEWLQNECRTDLE